MQTALPSCTPASLPLYIALWYTFFAAANAQFFQVGFKTKDFFGMSGEILTPVWNNPTKDVYVYAALQATHNTSTTADDQVLQPAMFSVAPNRNIWRTSPYLISKDVSAKEAAGKLLDLAPTTRLLFNMQRSRESKLPKAEWKTALRNQTRAPALQMYTISQPMDQALFTIEVYNGTFTPDMAPIIFRGLQIWTIGDDNGSWCSDANLYRSYARADARGITLASDKDVKTCHIESLKLYPLELAPENPNATNPNSTQTPPSPAPAPNPAPASPPPASANNSTPAGAPATPGPTPGSNSSTPGNASAPATPATAPVTPAAVPASPARAPVTPTPAAESLPPQTDAAPPASNNPPP